MRKVLFATIAAFALSGPAFAGGSTISSASSSGSASAGVEAGKGGFAAGVAGASSSQTATAGYGSARTTSHNNAFGKGVAVNGGSVGGSAHGTSKAWTGSFYGR